MGGWKDLADGSLIIPRGIEERLNSIEAKSVLIECEKGHHCPVKTREERAGVFTKGKETLED